MPRARMFMRPSGMPLEHLLDLHAQPICLSSSSESQRIPNSRPAPSRQCVDHAQVAVLEDVQRHALAWQRHEPSGNSGKSRTGGADMRLSLGPRRHATGGLWAVSIRL